MKKLIIRITSFVLALGTAFSSVTFSCAQNAEAETISEKDMLATTDKVERVPVNKDSIPEYLDVKSLIADGFTTRIKSDEQSLGEVVFENAEGIRSLYIFDENVKFYDKNGDIKDKSNKVVKKNNTFVSESNDIEAVLPVSIMSGISLKDDSLNITMRPVSVLGTARLNSVGQIKDEKSVLYENVFDEFTDVKYTFTYSGIKEDIILEKYNGVSSFNFEASTGGLSLTKEKDALILRDENGEAKAVMDEVIVFSADNKNNTFGEYTVKEKVKNSLYTITISVDTAYLTDPDTAYPVTIDPNAGIVSTSSNIQDLQVFKGVDGTGNTETSAGLSGVSRVGWTDWGACRTLVKINTNFSSYHITDSWQIIEAYIELRDLMCQGVSAPVTCSLFTGNDWDENTTETWNQIKADSYTSTITPNTVFYGNGSSSRNLSDSDQWYNWNIKSIVKKWADDHSKISKGLIFRMYNSFLESSSYAANMKTFSSMQGSASYKPYVCIKYKRNGCKPKRILETSDYGRCNCLMYAFFLPCHSSPDPFITYVDQVEYGECIELSIEDGLEQMRLLMSGWLDHTFGSNNWRDVTNEGYTATLDSDEWLVCMRVGNNGSSFDYHFWYRANDGNWYNKHGWQNKSEEMIESNIVNPSTANSSSGWTRNPNEYFYTSDTVYYAITAS